VRQIVLLAACLVTSAASARAASFDCTKAVTVVERTICADPGLSKSDDMLASTYALALEASLYPAALRAAQQQWLADRDKLSDVEALRGTYRERIQALGEARAKWQRARQPVSMDEARTRCVTSPDALSDDGCRVDLFAAVPGAPTLTYHLQSYMDGKLRLGGGVAVFESMGDRLRPVAVLAVETAHFDVPRVVASPAGKLLVIPGHLEGTGNFNAEAVYLYESEHLQDVDTVSWLSDLQRRLPKGWGAWKGIYPDYRTLTATTPLWQTGDGNCCPTAGRADLRLRLHNRRLTIDSIEIIKGESAARQDR
jgi:uncharacterized protein